jgi:hypothetical protein
LEAITSVILADVDAALGDIAQAQRDASQDEFSPIWGWTPGLNNVEPRVAEIARNIAQAPRDTGLPLGVDTWLSNCLNNVDPVMVEPPRDVSSVSLSR